MQSYIKQQHADLANTIETKKDLDAEAEKALTKAIEAFKATLA